MPGARKNQEKKMTSPLPTIKRPATLEEANDILGSCFACVMIHMNGMEAGWDTARLMEWKTFLIAELKKACEPEGWEHNGSVAFAWKVHGDCECQKSKIISITDGEQHDTGVMIEFVCRNVPREETRFNLRVVEGKLKAKYGDKFNLGAGRKCGNSDCDSIHIFPHVLGIQDGALMGHLENLEKLDEALKQNEEIRADNEKLKELGWKRIAETKEFEAKCDERCRHYDYLLDRECALVDGLATIQRYFRNGTIYNEDKKREVEEILTRLEFDPTDDEEEEEPVFNRVFIECPHAPEIIAEGVRRFHVCADKPEE